ncbi:MAG: C39 family peptidase [Blastocatellia bacterium]|nr:C39 family peptidase [Blastocatellia bacterium]
MHSGSRQPLGLLFFSVLLALYVFPLTTLAQSHVVSSSEIHNELVNAAETREKNLQKAQSIFKTDAAKQALESARMNPEQIAGAVSTLSDAELARLASRADKLNHDLAAGSLSDRDLLIILLGIAALVLIIVAVRLPAEGAAEIWLDVPFVKQEKNGCGAASIAMVMQYWFKQQGLQPDPGATDALEIQRVLYDPSANGIYASAMQRYLQEHGFRTFSFHGEWSDIHQHIKKGRPLIVALKPAGAGASLHYVVVAGLDPEQEIVLLNDPADRKLLKQDRHGFEKQWGATGNWTLLALPQTSDH